MATTPASDAGRTAIIAGGGLLPVEVAKGLSQRGETPFLIIVKGEGDAPALKTYPHVEMELEQFASVRSLLKANGIARVVMAGTIARRPRIGKLRPILPLLPAIGRFILALASGDDALLRTIIGYLEAAGVKVVGAHEVVPDLLVGEGVHTAKKPSKDDARNIEAAFAAAKAIGELDIGQAAVAIGGRAIALEGIEGTDGLLERVAALRGHGRLAGRAGGVLVKCAKPGQELRADLPGIGVNTVEAAHKAGLNGIAVEAERALGLGFGELIARADALGLFVVGLPKAGKN